MKVKLLKKIRKRYIITKVEENASNAGDVYKAVEKEFGLPFYVLEDSYDDWGLYTKFFKSFEEARDKLVKWIINDYKEDFRHKDQKSSKAWWVSK